MRGVGHLAEGRANRLAARDRRTGARRPLGPLAGGTGPLRSTPQGSRRLRPTGFRQPPPAATVRRTRPHRPGPQDGEPVPVRHLPPAADRIPTPPPRRSHLLAPPFPAFQVRPCIAPPLCTGPPLSSPSTVGPRCRRTRITSASACNTAPTSAPPTVGSGDPTAPQKRPGRTRPSGSSFWAPFSA